MASVSLGVGEGGLLRLWLPVKTYICLVYCHGFLWVLWSHVIN